MPNLFQLLDEDQLVAFAKLFNVNTDCLRYEIATFHHLLKRKDKNDHPKGLLQMLSYLESLKEAFSELHRIVLIACTLPVSTAECERNFSSMNLIKNELRSVMKQERLDSLMMLGIHQERGEKLDLDSVVDRFKTRFPKGRISLRIAQAGYLLLLKLFIVKAMHGLLYFMFSRRTRVSKLPTYKQGALVRFTAPWYKLCVMIGILYK